MGCGLRTPKLIKRFIIYYLKKIICIFHNDDENHKLLILYIGKINDIEIYKTYEAIFDKNFRDEYQPIFRKIYSDIDDDLS